MFQQLLSLMKFAECLSYSFYPPISSFSCCQFLQNSKNRFDPFWLAANPWISTNISPSKNKFFWPSPEQSRYFVTSGLTSPNSGTIFWRNILFDWFMMLFFHCLFLCSLLIASQCLISWEELLSHVDKER